VTKEGGVQTNNQMEEMRERKKTMSICATKKKLMMERKALLVSCKQNLYKADE
jgi:hypothetical protein